jgi:hypothetical protein
MAFSDRNRSRSRASPAWQSDGLMKFAKTSARCRGRRWPGSGFTIHHRIFCIQMHKIQRCCQET